MHGVIASMKYRSYLFPFLLITAASFVQGNNDSSSALLSKDDLQCHPWSFYNDTSKQCECYSSPHTDDIVKCNEHGASLQFGYCMTTHEKGDGFYVSPCNYFDLSKYESSAKNSYISLPSNISELNRFMCRPLNRKGVVCSQCMDRYGPSVTSVAYTCNECSDLYWLRMPLLGYLFLEFVLITIFYFVVLLLRLNLTSAPMVAFVLYSQFQGFLFVIISNTYVLDTNITLFWRILMIFYGIFNLDFCRYLIPAFCASPYIP